MNFKEKQYNFGFSDILDSFVELLDFGDPFEDEEDLDLMINENDDFNLSAFIPSAETLQAYNKSIENGGQSLIELIQNEQNNKYNIKVLELNNKSEKVTMSGNIIIFKVICAVTSLIICMLLASVLSLNGYQYIAGILAGTTSLGIIRIFFNENKKLKPKK